MEIAVIILASTASLITLVWFLDSESNCNKKSDSNGINYYSIKK